MWGGGRYEKEINFIQKGFEKGRFDNAVCANCLPLRRPYHTVSVQTVPTRFCPQVSDLEECFAIMLFDTKLSAYALVVAFYKCYPDLVRLHREVSISTKHMWFAYRYRSCVRTGSSRDAHWSSHLPTGERGRLRRCCNSLVVPL